MSDDSKPIRILLVDDSPLVLVCLKQIFDAEPDMVVIGTASNGRDALCMVAELDPTIVCTDLYMPVMDGLELTRNIMRSYPRPVLVLSNTIRSNAGEVFELLEAGAVEVCLKPAAALIPGMGSASRMLAEKLRTVAGVRVFTRHAKRQRLPLLDLPAERVPANETKPATMRALAIGASTGGPKALLTIFRELPPDFPVPIFCVQHICDGFLKDLINWMEINLRLKVKIAEEGELAVPGTIYFPPEREHLELDLWGRISFPSTAQVDGHRPSATVLFESVARKYGPTAIGVLLTGMGVDGAAGLHAMAQAGAVTIAQDEASCVVFGMPKAAIDLGAAMHVLPLDSIASKLLSLCGVTEGGPDRNPSTKANP